MTDKITIGYHEGFDESLRYEYDLKPTDKVLDIGSYRREFADKIIAMYGCEVECFDALDNKTAWLFDGKLQMGGNYLYTSSLADNPDKEYWCVDIAKYLQEEISLCKINIEGGEYELINYIGMKGLMHNIKNLQVQFHLVSGYNSVDLYEKIAENLSLTHRLTWRFPFVWENWERIC